MASLPRLKVGLLDMNNGQSNQAIRSFKNLVNGLFARARAVHPSLHTELVHVQPRNLAEQAPLDCDLYLSSGGPDSPHDGFAEPWAPSYRALLDHIHGEQQRDPAGAPRLFAVCYSFELATLHFGVARMEPREKRFGIMPSYPTDAGAGSALLAPFGDRLFAWEHRYWNAVDLDAARLAELGGELYARESRDGESKGPGLTSFRFTTGVEGTIFHPEADRAGALHWIQSPEQAAAVIAAYGDETYARMLKTLDDPTRLARTYALLIPGWLNGAFNALAPVRGWRPLPPLDYDHSLQTFALAS